MSQLFTQSVTVFLKGRPFTRRRQRAHAEDERCQRQGTSDAGSGECSVKGSKVCSEACSIDGSSAQIGANAAWRSARCQQLCSSSGGWSMQRQWARPIVTLRSWLFYLCTSYVLLISSAALGPRFCAWYRRGDG